MTQAALFARSPSAKRVSLAINRMYTPLAGESSVDLRFVRWAFSLDERLVNSIFVRFLALFVADFNRHGPSGGTFSALEGGWFSVCHPERHRVVSLTVLTVLPFLSVIVGFDWNQPNCTRSCLVPS